MDEGLNGRISRAGVIMGAERMNEAFDHVAAAQRHERFNCGLSYPPIRITDCEHEQRYGLSACAAQVNRGLPAIFGIAALELSPRKINIVHSPPPPEPRVLHGSGLCLFRTARNAFSCQRPG